MKLPQCDREQEVVDALRSGRWASGWGEEIRQHAAVCAVCAEVALVAQEFQREAELARAELQQPGAGLPSAGLVWWKAQLRRAPRRRAARRRAHGVGRARSICAGSARGPGAGRVAVAAHRGLASPRADSGPPTALRGDRPIILPAATGSIGSPRLGLAKPRPFCWPPAPPPFSP